MTNQATPGAATTMTINPPSHQSTSFINLARSSKYVTHLGWRGAEERKKPELTPDYSALVCSVTSSGIESPATELRAGAKLEVMLDCTIAPKKHWAFVTPTPALAEMFVVSGCTHYPPGYSGSPTLTLVSKSKCTVADIPLAAVHVMLLS